ncbi:MAG TPA: class I adenylate-forming enzyme family protein [Methanocorpusculum sp.]|nr:class I adenylate-forming enzyme family protein [Methanocorpusculum sp.]HJJ40215.1 class I adenylate-forming enzyme family protein [Methanocorpusculum sp.]HJJ49604.1 class I adenylate-forming enzyme family protein [Methanocorpusculum sp.]HJJ57689.1 class I adenylate-forming enzyme family protein [Methanocorpusculum sp.]
MSEYRNPSITHFEFTKENTRSLYSMLCYGAEHGTPEAEAIEYYGTRIKYGRLLKIVDIVAAGLCELGVKRGDFVTIFLPNIPQCIFAVYAVNRLGAICNLVHPLSSRDELEYSITLTKSRFVLAFEGNEGLCVGLGTKIIRCRTPTYFPHTPKGILMKRVFNHRMKSARKAFDAVEYTKVYKAGEEFFRNGGILPEDTMKREDTAAVMYTGGTTGISKGAVLSNAAINASTTNMMNTIFEGIPHIGMGFLSVLPVFHAFGFSLVIHEPLAGGMRMILRPVFNAKECAKLVLKERLETIAGVPTMLERMVPYFEGHDMSFVRNIAAGGDRVSKELTDRYNAILSHTKFRPGYGLTEACGCCILTDDTYTSDLPDGCIGKPMNQTEVCLVEPGTTKVIPDTEEGELCLINPALMTEYYQNKEATDAVLRKHSDGRLWLHTGDIATIDENRYVLFRSRYKRMIKVNGFNVYPTVIEDTMSSCPLVKEVCAVGMEYKNNMRIRLFVTLNDPSMNPDEAKELINSYAYEHVNRWSCPKEIRIIEKMPLTKMNKIDYRVLETNMAENHR